MVRVEYKSRYHPGKDIKELPPDPEPKPPCQPQMDDLGGWREDGSVRKWRNIARVLYTSVKQAKALEERDWIKVHRDPKGNVPYIFLHENDIARYQGRRGRKLT